MVNGGEGGHIGSINVHSVPTPFDWEFTPMFHALYTPTGLWQFPSQARKLRGIIETPAPRRESNPG